MVRLFLTVNQIKYCVLKLSITSGGITIRSALSSSRKDFIHFRISVHNSSQSSDGGFQIKTTIKPDLKTQNLFYLWVVPDETRHFAAVGAFSVVDDQRTDITPSDQDLTLDLSSMEKLPTPLVSIIVSRNRICENIFPDWVKFGQLKIGRYWIGFVATTSFVSIAKAPLVSFRRSRMSLIHDSKKTDFSMEQVPLAALNRHELNFFVIRLFFDLTHRFRWQVEKTFELGNLTDEFRTDLLKRSYFVGDDNHIVPIFFYYRNLLYSTDIDSRLKEELQDELLAHYREGDIPNFPVRLPIPFI